MLTVDFGRFPVGTGDTVLDLGCGAGRHAFEVLRRGASVVALDRSVEELAEVDTWLRAMAEAGEVPDGATARTVEGDALDLPFDDASFSHVIASEVLEHIPDDRAALAELVRVVRPGGHVAVTVPRYLPERICWTLSAPYHEVEGGHVRIYRRRQLRQRLADAGLTPIGSDHVHGLHSPYWWLKCAVGVDREDHPLVSAYHRMLVWDIERRPLATRAAERVLDPLIGKSVVIYARKDVR